MKLWHMVVVLMGILAVSSVLCDMEVYTGEIVAEPDYETDFFPQTLILELDHDASTLVCYNWLTPVAAPVDADLAEVWPLTCNGNYAKLEAGENMFTVDRRYPVGFLSIAVDSSVKVDTDLTDVTQDVVVNNSDCMGCTVTPVGEGPIVTTLSRSQEAYFEYHAATSNLYTRSINFTIVPENEGDAPEYLVYFGLGQLPTAASYDFMCGGNVSSCANVQVTNPPMSSLLDPIAWFFTIVPTGTRGGLVVRVVVTEDHCETVGEVGSVCSSNVQPLNETQFLGNGTFFVVENITEYDVFSFSGSSLDLAIQGEDSKGEVVAVAPDVWIQIDAVPNGDVFDSLNNGGEAPAAISVEPPLSFVQYSTGSVTNRVSIDLNTESVAGVTTIYIGVSSRVGGATRATDDVVSYVIWDSSENVCAGNCKNRGTCDQETLSCQCDDGWVGAACELEDESGIGIEYIVLIAVGGLLVLAIVIGVPVYCWMNRHDGPGEGYTVIDDPDDE
mmetsp:Transcript_11450/g.32162  ORF Transcript_11450/g.32162 Transcript_11450/m.32162 type:complete len:500 (+) Transcript_11450:949-2448(+)|eukprot:CAMPEP_0119119952 /NCGR_PEP_ID=MMETSP1310-20130426/1217_1 /TAXON_ID=464262 /ORGANISM="Genus nov. species nov., Strain RCC2339" /LENGTH=499 /DNA_ID=CAMNT_0007109411 /DNA_START=293 /DNA_END=1792 /DNA_ORIENTATION=-